MPSIVAELWSIFRSHPILHVAATLGPFWICRDPSVHKSAAGGAVCLALALAVMS
jgi:hypothetical protein